MMYAKGALAAVLIMMGHGRKHPQGTWAQHVVHMKARDIHASQVGGDALGDGMVK